MDALIEQDDPFAISSEDLVSGLNPEQKEVVCADKGPRLVLAGAGSGKTRTLTYRVAWLLSKGIAPWEILLLTFTNKAAAEMLARVQDLTGVPGFKFWGGTFHHIGQKLLRINGSAIGLEKNFTILDPSDAETILNGVIREIDPRWAKSKEKPKPKVINEMISYARNTRQELGQVIHDRYAAYVDFKAVLLEFAEAYRKEKWEQQVVDYDDLLEHALTLLKKIPEVREKYQSQFKHILVDEYQDTNPLQAELIDLIAHEHQIMAVGDDAQCIYTWRGADFENILNFEKRHPGAILSKIETNYRSTPQILDFANHVLASRPKHLGYDKTLKAVRQDGMKPQCVHLSDTRAQARYVLKQMNRLLGEGYALSEMAILYRAHHHSMDVQMELAKAQIPYHITSGVRFFEQAHIKDLVAQLRFASNPGDTASFQRFMLLLPKVGPRTAVRVLELAQQSAAENGCSLHDALTQDAVIAKLPSDARDAFSDLASVLQKIAKALAPKEERNLQQDDLFDQRAPAPTLSHAPSDETLSADPQSLVHAAIEGWYGNYLRHLHPNWEARRDDLESLINFASRYKSLDELLGQLALMGGETGAHSLEMKEDAIRLTTIHQSKGLEYPIVFILGLADGLFPIRRAIEAGDVEEERRLFYVAVTRAMDQLYLLYPVLSGSAYSLAQLPQSRFLKETPEHAYAISTVKGFIA